MLTADLRVRIVDTPPAGALIDRAAPARPAALPPEWNPPVSEAAESNTASVRYLSGNPRAQVIDLAEPVEVNGTAYTSFTVHRLTARDLEEHRHKTPEEREVIPIVNCDIAKEVLDALDADDADRLQGAAYDFLPQSWRTAFELSQSTLGPTPSSSDDGPVTASTEASTATGSIS